MCKVHELQEDCDACILCHWFMIVKPRSDSDRGSFMRKGAYEMNFSLEFLKLFLRKGD